MDAGDSSRKLTLTYSNGRIATISDGARTVTCGYDTTTGDLITVKDVRGQTTTYAYYTTSHLLKSITNPLNQLVEQVDYTAYTVQGKVKNQTLQDGQQLQFQYLSASTVITTTGVDGRRDAQAINYAADNTMTRQTVNGQAVLGIAFDDTLSPGVVRDGNNNETRATFSPMAQPQTVTNALGQTTQYTYDGKNNLIQTIDPLGITTRYRYDAFNNVISTTMGITTTSPVRATTLYTYTADGKLLTDQLSPDGVVTRYEYSGTQVVKTTVGYGTPLVQVTTYGYDSAGRVVTTTLGFGTPLARQDVTRYNADNTVAQTIQNYKDGVFSAAKPMTTSVQNCRTSGSAAAYQGCAPYSATARDRNIATRTQYDALGRTLATTQNYVDGAYDSTRTDEDITTQTLFDGVGRAVKTLQNYVDGTFDATKPAEDVSASTTYDALGRVMQRTDAVSAATTSSVNALGQTTVITDAVGRVSRMGYDGTGAQRWTRTPDGRVSVMQVDGLGRAVATIQNYQNGAVDTSDPADQDLITRTGYDAAGRRTQTRVATSPTAERVTQFAYDNLDHLLGVTENALTSGCTTGRTDCNVTTQYQYDRAGNRTAIIDARGNLRRTSYDAADRPTTATDALNRATSWDYDVGGRVTTQHDPRGAANDLSYQYDGLDRRLETNASNLGTLTAQYDALGRRLSMADSTGTTSFGYDALGRMTQLNAPAGTDGSVSRLSYAYNARGDRTQLTYPGTGAPVIGYSYFADGQLQSVTQSGTTLATYAYDSAGRLAQLARLSGSTGITNYRYDKADRPTAVQTSVNGTTVAGVSYTVDRQGLRTQATETLPASPAPSSTRIKTITLEGASLSDSFSGATVNGSVQLDSAAPLKGSYAAKVNATSSYLTQGFGNAGELYMSFYLRVDTAPASGSTGYVAQILSGSTSQGNLQLVNGGTSTTAKLVLRNGTTTIGSQSAALTKGSVYRVVLHQKTGSGNAIVEAYLATGDGTLTKFAGSSTQTLSAQATTIRVGSISSTTAAAVTVDDIALDSGTLPPASTAASTRAISYSYDGLLRLTGATESGSSTNSYSYQYDLAGNRTSVTANGTTTSLSYDAANQVIGWSYDAAGNLLNDGVTSYTYDALNRAVTTGSTTNQYNADGVLVQQGTTRYVQDLAVPLSQILSDGTTSYVYGQARLFALNGGTRTWYTTDALGSVRQILSDAGAAQGSVLYDPWGQVQRGTVPTFGFTGELQQGSQVYLRARWYNTQRGTFTSKDSFAGWPEQPYSLMPYQYAYANPVLLTDASGRAVSDGSNDTSCASGAVFDPVQYRTTGEGCIPILLDTTPPNWYPVDIGIVIGATVGCGLGVGGSAGIETVVDLYDFEVDTFFYGNAGPTTTVGAYANGYVGLVRGWSGFRNPGVANYGGISVSGGIGLGAFSVQGGVTPKEPGTGAQLKIVTIGAGVSLGLKVTGVATIDAALKNIPFSISGGVGKFGTLQDMFPNSIPPTAQIFHAPGTRPTLQDAQSLAAFAFRALNPQLALTIAEIALYNGVAWEMQTRWAERHR